MRVPASAERTRSFSKYASGERTASVAVERGKGESVILLADRIARGSYWDFSLPFFDLLEEMALWNEPEVARRRFVTRIRAERRVAQHSSGREDPKNSGKFSTSAPLTTMQESYSRLRRIRRAMLAMDGIPRSAFFVVPSASGMGFARDLKPIEIEAGLLDFPPTVRELSVALALFLEAVELGDIERYFQSSELLLATLSGLEADACLKASSAEVRQFILPRRPKIQELVNFTLDSRLARTNAPLTVEELFSREMLLATANDASHTFRGFGLGPAASLCLE